MEDSTWAFVFLIIFIILSSVFLRLLQLPSHKPSAIISPPLDGTRAILTQEKRVPSILGTPKYHKKRFNTNWSIYIDQMNATDYEKRLLNWLVYCESRGDEKAKNKKSAASGLLQFMPSTFRANCSGDIWSGEDQLQCTLEMIRRRQKHQWVCTKKGGF